MEAFAVNRPRKGGKTAGKSEHFAGYTIIDKHLFIEYREPREIWIVFVRALIIV